ncbi:hypothetical protein HZS_2813 [Henneguya salminicola]|nr:hypothetical protein HZS_2813 [Henneguya salminicola]
MKTSKRLVRKGCLNNNLSLGSKEEEDWAVHKLENKEVVKLIESYENKCKELEIPYIVMRAQTTRNIGRLVIEFAKTECAKSITILSNYIARQNFTGLSLSTYHIIHNSTVPVNLVPICQSPIEI